MAATSAATSLESALSLGGIGATTTAAPAAANNPAAVPGVLATTAAPAAAGGSAEPKVDTSGLTLASVLSLGNLLTQTMAPV